LYALNFRQSPSMIEICRNQVHTGTPHMFGLQPLAYHVYLWSNRHPKIAQTHGYIAGLDISLLLCSQLPPKSFNGRDMPESSPQRYPTRILFHSNCHHTCICVGIGTQKPLKFTIIFVYFATFMLSTCDKVLQSLSYAGSKSSYVPHTYFVSQPPPSYVYS
jgi:hypothetical protein